MVNKENKILTLPSYFVSNGCLKHTFVLLGLSQCRILRHYKKNSLTILKQHLNTHG